MEIERHNRDQQIGSIWKIAVLSVASIITLLLIEELRPYLPENLFEYEDVVIKTVGILIIIVVILISNLYPKELSRFYPKLNIPKIVIISGLLVFLVELAFKLVQHFFLNGNEFELDLLNAFKISGYIGLIGMLIANWRIHKIRGKSTTIPNVLIIIAWITIGMLLKN